jgi:hypothetical protein
MAARRFPLVPAGSILHYWVRMEPSDCATLSLDVTVNDVLNPSHVPVTHLNGAPPYQTTQIANRSPEPAFGPIDAGGSLFLRLTVAFLAAGKVAVVPTLEEPGGGVKTRDPIVFDGAAGQIDSADVEAFT